MLGDEGLPFIPNFYDVKELPKDYIYEKMEEEFDQQIGMYMDIKKVYIHTEYMSLLKKQEDEWISKNWRKLKNGNFYFIFNDYSW